MKKAVLVLFLAACASSNKRPVAPPLTLVPQAAVDAMCQRLRAEGMSADLIIVNESTPIVTPASLYGLAEISVQNAKPTPAVLQSTIATPAVAVEKPRTCAAKFITAAEARRAIDYMTIEFSPPIANPYVKGQTGTLVRMSLGGESSTWYWVALNYRGDQWVASMPAPVSVPETR